MHPFDRARDVMRLFREVTANAPDELTCLLILRKALPAPIIPPEYHGKPIAAIMAHWTGDPAEGAAAMRPLKAFGTPIVDTIAPKPFTAFQTALDGGQPFGRRYYWKSDEVDEVSDGLIETLCRKRRPHRLAVLGHPDDAHGRRAVARSGGGDAGRHPRRAIFGVVTQGAWEKPEEDAAADRLGARAAYAAVRPSPPRAPT